MINILLKTLGFTFETGYVNYMLLLVDGILFSTIALF